MSYLQRIQDQAKATSLNNDEIARYSRHLILPEVTMEGQKKLKAAKVLVVGTGGLGSPLIAYLGAAGVGTVGIMDFDRVDHSNLQRQIIHFTSSVGMLKTESAARTLKEINPFVNAVVYNEALTSANALEICRDYDLVIDGTDNFPTRYLVNDVCALLGKPNVYGSIYRWDGQVTVFWAEKGPCYRCLYPEPPDPGLVPSCAEGGVLGVLPGVVGCLQATEAIKLIIGKGDALIGKLLVFDALKMKFRELKVRKDPDCPLCGPKATLKELIDYNQFCGVKAVDDASQKLLAIPYVPPKELAEKLKQAKRPVLLDIRAKFEHEICALPGARLIPLPELPKRLHELDSADDIVIYCKNDQRSEAAFRALQQAGFKKLAVLEGGIDAWAEDVDPDMPTY
jgi:adenylyltransferase/sulfurtransferase